MLNEIFGRRLLTPAALLLIPSAVHAQGVAVGHDPTIECFPVGKYTLVRAQFPEGARVARARTYFRRATMPETWFYIEMKVVGSASGALFEGGLPKPKKELVGEVIDYYVSGETIDANTGQTQEFHGEVVRSIEECRKRPLLARSASPGNFPPGFTAAAFPVAAVVVGAGAATGGAVALAASSDDEPPGTTSTTSTTTTTTTTTTTMPAAVTVDCTARPNEGIAPVAVDFTATPQGGTGAYRFDWSFGPPGATSTQQNPSFTYTAPGVYNAVVRVTSPPQDPANPRPGTFADCRRVITVREPPPPPPATTTLRVDLVGDGTGTVNLTGPGVDCTADCSQNYGAGAPVTLTATADTGSDFIAWGGACSAAGSSPTCSVAMNTDLDVTAQFSVPKLLTVDAMGCGSGSAISDPPGINCPGGEDCQESYTHGTVVSLVQNLNTGSQFVGWSGDCTGTDPNVCTVVMDAPRNVVADRTRRHTVTVTCDGTADESTGEVVSTPPGIDCDVPPGESVSAEFECSVTLAATMGAGTNCINMTGPGLCNADCDSPSVTCNIFLTGPETVDVEFETFIIAAQGEAAAARGSAQGLRRPSSPTGEDRRGSLVTELNAGRGRLLLNGQPMGFSGRGLASLAVAARAGLNRVDAEVLEGDGRPGYWRFDLGGLEGFRRGTIRVVGGAAEMVTPDTIVFRLRGRAGERVSFAFDVQRE